MCVAAISECAMSIGSMPWHIYRPKIFHCVIIIIIIIIMSLFNEDNIFSTSTNLTYGPRWKTYLTEQYHTIYTLYT